MNNFSFKNHINKHKTHSLDEKNQTTKFCIDVVQTKKNYADVITLLKKIHYIIILKIYNIF